MSDRTVGNAAIAWKAPVLKVLSVKDLTRNGSGSGTDGGTYSATMGMKSDCRVKTDVTQIAVSASGLPIYQFRYLHDRRLHEGVMAQDMLRLRPEAVSVTEVGTYMVDYSLLDVMPRVVE